MADAEDVRRSSRPPSWWTRRRDRYRQGVRDGLRAGAARGQPRQAHPAGVFDTVATSGAILELADRLICQGVTRVVTEATLTYWQPYRQGR